MLRYIFWRIAVMVPTLLIISALIFTIIELHPGDYFETYVAELQAGGKLKGAVNVPRGMLEFRADPESPYHNGAFVADKTVLVYCASGGRSALSGKTLKDLGYAAVYNIGGFKELADAGLETEPA